MMVLLGVGYNIGSPAWPHDSIGQQFRIITETQAGLSSVTHATWDDSGYARDLLSGADRAPELRATLPFQGTLAPQWNASRATKWLFWYNITPNPTQSRLRRVIRVESQLSADAYLTACLIYGARSGI